MGTAIAKIACCVFSIIAFLFVRQAGGANLLEYWPRYGVLLSEIAVVTTGLYVIVKDESAGYRLLFLLIVLMSLATTYSTIRQIGAISYLEEILLELWRKKGIEV